MREIKFRVWVPKLKRMGKVSEINFMTGTLVVATNPIFSEIFRLRQVRLMRYTGLDDVNGNPIYEGDIVKSKYKYAQPKISQIIIEDGNSYIAGEDLATGNEMLVSDHVDEIEVIGNVHTNPELLEENKWFKPTEK